jgi:hypothetical protein
MISRKYNPQYQEGWKTRTTSFHEVFSGVPRDETVRIVCRTSQNSHG